MTGVRAELTEGRIELGRWGAVVEGDPSLPFVVVDPDGAAVEPISRFLQDLALSDASPLSCRSYAHDLLRWWRLLGLLEVGWDRATTDDVATLVGWLRYARNPQRRRSAVEPGSVNLRTGKRTLPAGYAPSTINHSLSVISGFYDFHASYGRGPLANPVPNQSGRQALSAQRASADRQTRTPRARLRQRPAERQPRSIPDAMWDELFDSMTCDRDRALLACYVSSGARASELLGVTVDRVDWAGQRLWVMSKGSRLLEEVPASPDAFVYLAGYLADHGLPADGEPLWRTLHGPVRPLTYSATRAILNRANAKLGTNWTLHDMRHTAATRMARDPALTLTDVQTVMRHRQLSTTQRYTRVRLDDLIETMQEHYARPRVERHFASGYATDDVRTVFGE